MKRRTSQQDIANLLGIDKSTVSLALRNSPRIAEETRTRVKKAAKELDYRPEPTLSLLAKQRWLAKEDHSGLALTYLVDSRLHNYSIHNRFLPGAIARAEERGYNLRKFDLAEYGSIESAIRVLNHRGIRGLIVPPLSLGNEINKLTDIAGNFTIVALDFGPMPLPYHLVTSDMFSATRLVWERAIERGYHRIGAAMLSHTPRAFDDATRFGASSASREEWTHQSNQIPILTTHHQDKDSFIQWLDHNNPDAVIGFIKRTYDWILSTGRRVPQDIAFACLCVSQNLSPQISGTLLPDFEVGAEGVDALVAAMHANEWGVPIRQRKLLIKPEWHEGATLPNRQFC